MTQSLLGSCADQLFNESDNYQDTLQYNSLCYAESLTSHLDENNEISQIAQNNLKILPQITFNNSVNLSSCIEQASYKFLPSLQFAKITTITGGGGDDVFLVEKNQSAIVIKAFSITEQRNRINEFYHEFLSLHFVNSLNTSTIFFPELYGASVCNFLDGHSVLIYQEYIRGFTLKHYVESIKKYDIDSNERTDALSTASNIFSTLGKSLYEFHYINSDTTYSPMPDSLFLEYSNTINKALNKLEKYNRKKIDISHLSSICNELLFNMKHIPIRLGLSHEDIHFGNIMILNNKIYIIDLYRLFPAIRIPNHPMGIPLSDYFFITNFFFPLREERYRRVGKTNSLLNKEIDTLVNNFVANYNINFIDDTYSLENNFFLMNQLMLFINMSFERSLIQNHTRMNSALEEYFWAGTDIVLDALKTISSTHTESKYCFDWRNSCPNYNNLYILDYAWYNHYSRKII